MYNWFRNKKRDEEVNAANAAAITAAVDERIRQIKAKEKEEAAAEVQRLQELKEAAALADAEQKAARQNSSEPWAEIVFYNVNIDGVVEVKFDWNPAWIEYLKKHGFEGDEDYIMQKYAGAMFRQYYEDGKNTALNVFNNKGFEKDLPISLPLPDTK